MENLEIGGFQLSRNELKSRIAQMFPMTENNGWNQEILCHSNG